MTTLRYCTLSLLCCWLNLAAANAVTVTANGEILQGESANDIAIFRGIPFAQPPIGNLRWQAPLPHSSRKGLQTATDFSPACMQGPHIVNWYKDLVRAFGEDTNQIQSPAVSEDCLYLNIWTPKLKASGQKLPVMVWIHGGSNKGGWSYEPNYLGHKLAEQNVVVVSIAYRLGVFGFFTHPDLSRQQTINSNFGLLDQIAALQWIQNHITAFGGDADNITLFGESAGAANIGYLMASPLSKGLFQRAIHQSAGFEMQAHGDRANHEQLAENLATALAVKTIDQLRDIDPQTLLEASEKSYQGHYFNPIIDQHVLLEEPLKRFAGQQQHPVDLMIGTNAHEWTMYLDKDTDKADVTSYIEQNAGAAAQQALKQWAGQQSDQRLALDRLYTAKDMLCPSLFMAGQVNNSWVYFFSRQRAGKGGESLKAYHGAEIAYVFDTHDEWLPTLKPDRLLTQAMVSYWTNFAKTGNPNSSDLAIWPRFKKSSDTVMELGDNIAPIATPEPLLCQWLGPDLTNKK